MKKILITGANSYVGTSFEKWLSQWPDKYHVDTIDMIDGSWREKSFAGYDAVFHVAGIAHRKETKQNAHLYYEVNRDLAIETAKKAKAEGVPQFIFMSSMSVYGMDTGVITKDTVPNPKSHYGKSKLEAEYGVTALADDSFHVAVLRPPMIYGKGCKGNYQRLRSFVLKYKVFPNITNKRSVVYIDNLITYVQKCLDSASSGIFAPQDPNYMCTKNMVWCIAQRNGQRIFISSIFNVINTLNFSIIKKTLGDLYYQDIDRFSSSGKRFPDTVFITEEGSLDK